MKLGKLTSYATCFVTSEQRHVRTKYPELLSIFAEGLTAELVMAMLVWPVSAPLTPPQPFEERNVYGSLFGRDEEVDE